MDYNIKVGKPPNFMEIIKMFPKAIKANTIFAYQDTIYVSNATIRLDPPLIAHECVHLRRQQDIGVKEWWKKYLEDHDFRYQEELLAHRAEYKKIIGFENNEARRASIAKVVAKRLIAPLYKFNVTLEKAAYDIKI